MNRARQQQQNAIETSPQRGDLIDRQGRELARSVQTVSLFVDPDQLSSLQLDCTASELAKALGENETDLRKQLQSAQDEKRRFVWIVRRLDAEKATPILALNLPGVQSVLEPKRYYERLASVTRAWFCRTRWARACGVRQKLTTKDRVASLDGCFLKDAAGRSYGELRNRCQAGPIELFSRSGHSVSRLSARFMGG